MGGGAVRAVRGGYLPYSSRRGTANRRGYPAPVILQEHLLYLNLMLCYKFFTFFNLLPQPLARLAIIIIRHIRIAEVQRNTVLINVS